MIKPEAFNALSDDERKAISTRIEGLQKELAALLESVPRWERDRRGKVRELDASFASVVLQIFGPASAEAWIDDLTLETLGDTPTGDPSPAPAASSPTPGGPLSASIQIDPSHSTRPVSPWLFGMHIEWVENGLGLLESDRPQLREAVLDALRPLHIPLFRFPGGIHADYYDWSLGVRLSDATRADLQKLIVQDWKAIRGRLGIMIALSVTGIGAFNTMQYWSLEHTQAINTLLLQPTAPLFVAMWSLALFGTRLTAAQAFGILLSLTGVLVIMLRGDLAGLANIDFNRGDLIFVLALLIFGFYSVLSAKRPAIHPLSFVAFTFGCGAACLIPLLLWELATRPAMELNGANLLTLFYVAAFPSTLAYLCFNRGVALIGANRAAPFFHLVPVFGTVMSILFLGEHPQLFHFIGFALVLTGVFVASRKPEGSTGTA